MEAGSPVVLDHMPSQILSVSEIVQVIYFCDGEIMLSFCISRPECFLANIARDGNPFQMIGLDVFLQIIVDGLLSTGHTFIH